MAEMAPPAGRQRHLWTIPFRRWINRQFSPAPAAQEVPSAQAADTPPAAGAVEASNAGKVRVTTDVLIVDIDLKGGTLVRAELPGYPLVKGKPEPVVLLNQDSAATNYVIQSGLAAPPKAEGARPTHLATFASAAAKYDLAPGQDELRVPLTWTDGQGVTVTKTFVFHRSMFSIGLEQAIRNDSAAPWTAAQYARISRVDPKVERSMFHVESYAYRVPAIWAPEKSGPEAKNIYRKLNIEKPEQQNMSLVVTNGWLAGIQHHFTSAIIPDPTKSYTYTLQAKDRHYILGALAPAVTVAPGKSVVLKDNLFVGPKLQRQLETLHPELSRVADYGLLTPLSKPLFWLLDHAHAFVRNWGVAIMLVTFLLKLAFYPLSEKAGRSMARMRKLAPRMKALQETYKDDRSKLGQATMELYKQEKVNPLAGCLPMIIQMPVFLAFYGCCSKAWKCARRPSSAGSTIFRHAIPSSFCRCSMASQCGAIETESASGRIPCKQRSSSSCRSSSRSCSPCSRPGSSCTG
jgi:YidC/Oxa1 family membrane protein insertase